MSGLLSAAADYFLGSPDSTDYSSALGDLGDSSSSVDLPSVGGDASQAWEPDFPTSGDPSTAWEPDFPNSDPQQSLGAMLNPSVSMDDVASKVAAEGKDNPSFLHSLANQLGVMVKDVKNPLASLSAIVGAIGAMRNSGPYGANRQSALTGVNNLLNNSSMHSGYNAAATPRAPATPSYYAPNNFIVQPPASTGPLTLIKTNKG